MPRRVKIDCDRCAAPGMCCKAFFLSMSFPVGSLPASVSAVVEQNMGPHPFTPLRRITLREGYNPDADVEHWLFGCSALQPDGRCGVYDKRPQLCRDYTAGQDPMCVHYVHEGKPVVPMKPKPKE